MATDEADMDPRCDECWIADHPNGGRTVRCIRAPRHTGRHMARHPAELGEYVYKERVK